ncbi:MAG: hypothetical protein IKN77_02085 [Paludibacteraceae bacterium]|nr:hypothetical protein [Paludibacteraceae bacterium]
MEQLKHLGGRLLGKKSVAVILGLLGLCSPSSLWAEKLDTTFVLDMVIDSTPCYYTKYNNAGQIVEHGLYRNGGTVRSYDFGKVKNDYYRINTGYVTNEKGDTLNILYYTCDNVTKQWFPNNIIGKWFEYHDNGILSGAKYIDSTTVVARIQSDLVERTVPDHTLENKFRPDGYRLSLDYVDVDVSYGSHYLEEEYAKEHIKYDSLGNAYYKSNLHEYYDIANTYDDRHNLVSSRAKGNYSDMLEEHSYDSLDRRIKTVRYDSTKAGFVIKDSIIYTYGNSLKEGEPCILSVFDKNSLIDGFSSEQFHYDLSDATIYTRFKYITPYKTTTEESFDVETNTLSIKVKGANYDYDSTDANTYTFVLKKMESYITAMSFNNKMFGAIYDGPVEDFSSEKYSYDISEDYYMYYLHDEYVALYRNDTTMYLHYRVSEDAEVENSYDAQTGIVTIIIKGGDYAVNPTNTHTYTFTTRKVDEAYISSVRIKGNDLSGFSPDKNDYEMPFNYIWDGMGSDDSPFSVESSDFDFSVYPGFLSVDKSYDDSTHTLICSIYNYVAHTKYIYNTYRFHFQPSLKSISSLTINGEPLDTFSADIHDYWFNAEYIPDMVSYTLPDGVTATESFDDSTNVLMVRLALRDAIKTVEYKFHFRPVDGVADFLGDHVSLYATDKTICVDGATEPIYVYDLLCTMVGTGRGEEVRIPVRQAGVYVVKAGEKAAKVVVK